MSKASRRMLVVDDDPKMTRLVQKYFEETAVQVSAVNQSEAALPILKAEGFPVVLLDIDMPVLNGLDLLREIKRFDATIQVVMMTGYNTLSNLTSAYQGGAEFILIKPLDKDRLVNRVHRCFEKWEDWRNVIASIRIQRSRAIQAAMQDP